MNENSPVPPARPAQIKRLQIGLNVIFQVLIVLTVVGMINYISFRQFKRWDLSRSQKFALSTMTTRLLTSLAKPVKAIVFFNGNVPIVSDVNQLLREYEFASKRKFEVEMVDPYNNVVRAKELAAQYKFGSSDNIVILDAGGRTKFINVQEMAEFDTNDQLATLTGQPPRLRAFKGEQAITSALLEITEDKQNKAYVVSGHGEPDFKGPALTNFKAYAERQNIKLQSLNLNEVDKVPEDASVLVILGPRADFSDREIKLTKDYWSRNGRLLVLLDPDGRTPRLDNFLVENGAVPTHDRVLRTGTTVNRDENQQVGLRTVILLSPTAVYPERGREITKDLTGIDTSMLGATQSLQVDPKIAISLGMRTFPLLEASKEYWGETEYNGGKDMPFFDPSKDHRAPLTLAAALEKGAVADNRVKVDTARLIVAGNAAWLTDEGLRVSEQGIDFTINCLNWLLNREQLLGIPPKAKEPIHLDLNEAKIFKIAVSVIFFIPGLFAAFGFGTWLMRRS